MIHLCHKENNLIALKMGGGGHFNELTCEKSFVGGWHHERSLSCHFGYFRSGLSERKLCFCCFFLAASWLGGALDLYSVRKYQD